MTTFCFRCEATGTVRRFDRLGKLKTYLCGICHGTGQKPRLIGRLENGEVVYRRAEKS